MIAKIARKQLPDGRQVRGSDPVGLMLYLFGPGKANEHTDPHIVAADVSLGAPDGQRYGDKQDIIDLGHDIDGPRRLYGTEFPGGHIWHLVLANPPQDRLLSDAEWADVAREAMDRMGFTQASGKAACRWVAVRHGLSAKDNDHIHIAVNLIREDGTRATIWNDRPRIQKFAAEMERRYGLTVVEGRTGAGVPGASLAEREIAGRRGHSEPARQRLARGVRAAADEAEFVRRLRGSGVLVRPRYAAGGRAEVVGYSTALRPGRGEVPIWFGGGKLAPDLTLARLRTHWPQTAAARYAAVEEWSGRTLHRTGGREDRVLRAAAWAEAAERINGAIIKLSTVDVDDWETWAGVAREASGVYAALSARLEGNRPALLARASATLARSAQSRHGQPRARRTGNAASVFRGAQMVAIQASSVGGTAEGEALLVRAMFRIVRTVHESHVARGDATQAARLADLSRSGLATLHQTLLASDLARTVTSEPTVLDHHEPRPSLQSENRPHRDFQR